MFITATFSYLGVLVTMAGDGAAQFSAQVTRVRNVGKFVKPPIAATMVADEIRTLAVTNLFGGALLAAEWWLYCIQIDC